MANPSFNLALEEEDYPANYRPNYRTFALPAADFDSFLEKDLSVKRLENIRKFLWVAGKPYLPRPLNQQAVLDRTIIPSTDASLHLVWTTKKIFIKPLPRYMLSNSFFEKYLKRPTPHRPALGLLNTYLALVPTEHDFAVAKSENLRLIPEDYEWRSWRTLTRQILEEYPDEEIYEYMPKRYRYGELRLSRLDKIYQLVKFELLHGYSPMTGHTRYIDFLAENRGSIAVGTVYIAVVLSAMQVGLATTALSGNVAFENACYGFAMFAIIFPLAILSVLIAVFVFMLIVNSWQTTLKRHNRHQVNRRTTQGRKHGAAGGSMDVELDPA